MLKHRKVKHFGYEFLYGSNNIDRSKPLAEKIPDKCKALIDKMLESKLIEFIPDQLTVNQYEPGQGLFQSIYSLYKLTYLTALILCLHSLLVNVVLRYLHIVIAYYFKVYQHMLTHTQLLKMA